MRLPTTSLESTTGQYHAGLGMAAGSFYGVWPVGCSLESVEPEGRRVYFRVEERLISKKQGGMIGIRDF